MASSSATRTTGWCSFLFSLMNPAHFPGQISDTPVATLLHRSWPSWLPSMFFCLCHSQAHRQAPWTWLLKQLLLPHHLTRNLLILLHNNSFGIKFLLERSFFFFQTTSLYKAKRDRNMDVFNAVLSRVLQGPPILIP